VSAAPAYCIAFSASEGMVTLNPLITEPLDKVILLPVTAAPVIAVTFHNLLDSLMTLLQV